MNIPSFKKLNPNDSGCAPVCLQMALAYYGINKSIEEIYKVCESIGDSHFTLPWGICIGAAKFGLRTYFISERPFELNDDSRLDIMNITRLSYDQIVEIERDQLERCDASNSINIMPWDDGLKQLPFKILERRLGVVIPTLWWGTQPHNIVLIKHSITRTGQSQLYYHDPNTESPSGEVMSEAVFFKMWIHGNTDNDLLIITSNQKGIDSIIAARARTKSTVASAAAAAAHAAAVAAMAQFARKPIVSLSKKIIWQNVFNNYPIPKVKTELTITKAKEWSLMILKSLKEYFPTIPLNSSPDPEDNRIISDLIIKYKADPNQIWFEIDLLQRIMENYYKANDNEIFFLLYRLREK